MEKIDYNNADLAISRKSYYELENECQWRFDEGGKFWHLYTNGNATDILFTNHEEFCFGMNLIPWCLSRSSGIRILTFVLMSNHIHMIISGENNTCLKFFESYKERLKRYFFTMKKVVDLSHFEANLFQIDNLTILRNEIVYVNRNAYLVNNSHTPFSYIWGTSNKIYNDKYFQSIGIKYNSLTITRRREICHSKEIEMPDNMMVVNEIIDPLSYCHIEECEQYFRNAHHYFYLLTKNHEVNSEIAKRLIDTIIITDDEMYSAISSLCYKSYQIKQPSLLPAKDKITLAKKMHFSYNATNKQINRILKLDLYIIEDLFGSKSKSK